MKFYCIILITESSVSMEIFYIVRYEDAKYTQKDPWQKPIDFIHF